MNNTTKIITAAFTAMLLCSTVAAYTYEPMPARSDYDDHRTYQDAYTQRAMDDYQKIADDRRTLPKSGIIEDRELERKIQMQIRDHEQAPYGIPKQREPMSYGKRSTIAKELPDAYPNDKQTPGLHPVFVLCAVVASILVMRRRAN